MSDVAFVMSFNWKYEKNVMVHTFLILFLLYLLLDLLFNADTSLAENGSKNEKKK